MAKPAPTATFAGVRARFTVNADPVAYCGQVSGNETFTYEPVNVLDLVEVKEYCVTGYTATMNAQMFRIVGDSLRGRGIYYSPQTILTQQALDASVQDRLGSGGAGTTAYQFVELKPQEKSWETGARSIVSENVSFNCIRIMDETQT